MWYKVLVRYRKFRSNLRRVVIELYNIKCYFKLEGGVFDECVKDSGFKEVSLEVGIETSKEVCRKIGEILNEYLSKELKVESLDLGGRIL